MTQFGSQVQTAVHVRLASAAALATCTYSSASSVLPSNTDLGAKLVATSNGALTIDGVAAAVDDEVLIKDQVATLQNGVYRVRSIGGTSSTWSLERSKQARDSGQFDGMLVSTGPEGSSFPSALFIYSGAANPTIGTTAITFAAQTGADLSLYATKVYVTDAIANLYGTPTLITLDHTAGGSFTAGLATPSVNWVTSDNATTILGTTTIGSTDGDTAAGWELVVTFIVASTTVAHAANFSATGALALPTVATAGQSFRYIWDDSVSKWKRST